jgi:hypothetical protein
MPRLLGGVIGSWKAVSLFCLHEVPEGEVATYLDSGVYGMKSFDFLFIFSSDSRLRLEKTKSTFLQHSSRLLRHHSLFLTPTVQLAVRRIGLEWAGRCPRLLNGLSLRCFVTILGVAVEIGHVDASNSGHVCTYCLPNQLLHFLTLRLCSILGLI